MKSLIKERKMCYRNIVNLAQNTINPYDIPNLYLLIQHTNKQKNMMKIIKLLMKVITIIDDMNVQF